MVRWPQLGRPVVQLLSDLGDEGWQQDWSAFAVPFGANVVAAWEASPRADWLLLMAKRLGVDRLPLTLAAADCLDDTMTRSQDLRPMMAAMAAELRACALGERSRSALEALTQRATHEASSSALHAQQAGNPDASARFERWALALRALANTCEELAWLVRSGETTSVWPTCAALLAQAEALGALPRRRRSVETNVQARHAALVRERIPAPLIAAYLAQPAGLKHPPGAPCYLEVRFTREEAWHRLANLWLSVGEEKSRGLLDAADEGWRVFLAGTGFTPELLHATIARLASGRYELASPRRLGSDTGRLEFHPRALPFGDMEPMEVLAQAFGMTVVARDDGRGRVER